MAFISCEEKFADAIQKHAPVDFQHIWEIPTIIPEWDVSLAGQFQCMWWLGEEVALLNDYPIHIEAVAYFQVCIPLLKLPTHADSACRTNGVKNHCLIERRIFYWIRKKKPPFGGSMH